MIVPVMFPVAVMPIVVVPAVFDVVPGEIIVHEVRGPFDCRRVSRSDPEIRTVAERRTVHVISITVAIAVIPSVARVAPMARIRWFVPAEAGIDLGGRNAVPRLAWIVAHGRRLAIAWTRKMVHSRYVEFRFASPHGRLVVAGGIGVVRGTSKSGLPTRTGGLSSPGRRNRTHSRYIEVRFAFSHGWLTIAGCGIGVVRGTSKSGLPTRTGGLSSPGRNRTHSRYIEVRFASPHRRLVSA